MFNRSFPFFAFLPAIVLMATSCKKEAVSNIPTAGKLSGTVQTWDDKLNNTTDRSGVTVTITNLTNVSAVTDANGRYSFENIAFDLYDLSFNKAGYGTFKVFGVSHTSNNSSTELPLVGLGRTSTTSVTALSVNGNTINGEPGVTFNYDISPAPSTASRAFVRYFLGTTASVSNSNYVAFTDVLNFSNLSNVTGFTQSQLLGWGFTSGQTVYAKMYGDSFKSNEYTVPNTGITIFPNINPVSAPPVSFVVP